MTRSVMASRLPREVSVAGRRVTAGVWVLALIVAAVAEDVEEVATDFVEADLEEVFEEGWEEEWDLRPLDLVLKGFATGARVMVPSALIPGFEECFFVAVSIA
jgi:hypothetical protein